MKKSRILVYFLLFLFLSFIAIKANKFNNFTENQIKKMSTNTTMNIQNTVSIDKVPQELETAQASLTVKTNDKASEFSEMTKLAKKRLPKNVFATYTISTKDGITTKKLYKVKKGAKYCLINEDNQKLTNPVYDDFSIFDNDKGIYISYRNGRKGLVNAKGRMLAPTKFENFEQTKNEDIVLVKTHKYVGLYDLKNAKAIIPAIHTEIIPLDSYNWKIISNKKQGILNYKNGKITVIKPKYHTIQPYKKSYKTTLGSKFGLIDLKSGDVISEPLYDEVELINEQKCEKDNILIFRTRIDNRYGVIYYSKNALTSISPIYEEVQFKGLVNVLSNGYWRILDNKGNVVSRTQGAFK